MLQIIMRVLAPNLQNLYNDLYSQEVQNLLKMTNLRINFTKLHTLGDDLLDNRDEIKVCCRFILYTIIHRCKQFLFKVKSKVGSFSFKTPL